ncbi:MAG TPA: HAMP domain-containing sensor histidine kinase [Candidatus Tectomicrobia bacterium]|nr:HAMP domain-containing sensor histidine kinase [Candidatus Tectomicrobia bacterium]
MRLTIFWRIMLAQVSLIALIVVANLYALSHLHRLSSLSDAILTSDSASIEEKRRLLRVFLAQMRIAEKYVLFQDKAFHDQFVEGSNDFDRSMGKIAKLIGSPRELDLLEEIRDLHGQYAASLAPVALRRPTASRDRAELSESIATRVNELIRLREEAMAQKTAAARDQSAVAARMVSWLTFGGIGLSILLAYLHARRVSRPLKKLAQELRLVGKGEFQRYLDIQSPEEIGELFRAFNWTASRLAKLDEMKEDFIAHISHELRTPLTAIREGTTLLWEEIAGPLTASQREIIDVVRNHSERLYRFLSYVLDLSKMEAGMMEYVQVPSDVSALVNRSVQTVQLTAQRKRIRLEVICPAGLPLLSLDEGRIQQVLDNLLNNAMKFTPDGGIVRVTAALKEEGSQLGGKQWVEIRVSDTGAGIPPEEIERIFNKFYQSPQHQSQRERGTGLGLAIARHIVEAHGGRIWVESQLSKGSTFILLLPAHRYDNAQASRGQVAVAAEAPGVTLSVREERHA